MQNILIFFLFTLYNPGVELAIASEVTQFVRTCDGRAGTRRATDGAPARCVRIRFKR